MVELIKTGSRMDLNKTWSSYEVDLNKSVVECDNIMKKSVIKEMEAMTPVLVKQEVDLAKFECNYCNKSFSSAAPLTSHLESHYARSTTKLMDCPFQLCEFQGNDCNLTKHMRSKHTDEMLFSCSVCTKRFFSMTAKSEHEAKHNKPELVWCGDCSRFNKVEHGGCKKCQPKEDRNGV